MSNLFKKVTSAVAGLAIVFSVVSPIAGVNAAYTSLEAANKLGSVGVIVDQSSNPADYRLGDTLTRREHTKVAMNLASCQAVSVSDTCNGSFSDMDSSDWGCKYAETALANGFVAANATYNPGRDVSQAEALKMVMNATGVAKGSNSMWEAAYVEGAVSAGILSESFSDYTTAATRGWIFQISAEALELCNAEDEDEGSILDDLLGDLGDDDDTTSEEETTEETTPVVSGDDKLMVSLSPSTPDSATIPGGVNGLPVASFDFTAGSSDVTVSQVTVKRRGLSDGDTLTDLAIFTAEGRASNSKNDNQENNTEAQINLSNGGVVVKAGETKTITVIADIAGVANAANDEFALEIVDVQSSSDAEMSGSLVANTMRIGSVDAPTVTVTTGGSVSNPQLGESGADIFEFEVDGSNDEDVVLKSLTFEATGDAEENLMNFELYMDNDLVASTQYMNDDYLTFDLGDGLTIEEDKNHDFTVRADVVAGAGEQLGFNVDESLDITAESTKFGYGAAVNITAVSGANAFGQITIEAGELTLMEIDADFDEVREDKDNVVLGGFTVTNVSGNSLELEQFGVNVNLTAGTAFNDDGAGTPANADNNVQDAGELALTLTTLFDEVELYSEDTGSSYQLDLAGTVYSDTSIDLALPQGVTTWYIRADIAENIGNFDQASFDLNFSKGAVGLNGGFYVIETEDDTQVTDITPSSLSFNSIDGSESGAKLAVTPISTTTDVVRGSSEVVVAQFTVEAEESSAITIDEFTVNIQDNSGNATDTQISEVTLYEGSVSESNRLATESDIASGNVTFDRMDEVLIDANATKTFVVTVSFVDGLDAVNGSAYTASVTGASIEDDENEDIDVSASLPLVGGRSVTVNNAGSIATLALDSANSDNEFDKVALAGGSAIVGSHDVRADNEVVEVDTVVYTISGGASLSNTVVDASLVLDGVVVATNTNADITNTTITFEDANLMIPETTAELALQLNTANIGKDFVGVAQTNLAITDIAFSDAEGAESGKAVANVNQTATSKVLDIVAAVVTPTVVSQFGENDTTAELKLVVDGGDNTTATGDAVQVELTGLTYQANPAAVTVENSNGIDISVAGSDSVGNDDETYTLRVPVGALSEGTYTLATNGVSYTINGAGSFTTKLESTLELGTYNDN